MEWFFGAIVLIVILNNLFKPKKCDVCGFRFKKSYSKWKIDGKTLHLCPNCSSQMERKISRKRFKDRFG